jgi:hypothetical protein
MQTKFLVLAALFGLSYTHPVNQQIVDDIKTKTTHWTPMKVSENPVSKWSEADIKARLGTILTKPFGF